MSGYKDNNQGFSAVELLVSLVVASIFLFAGYAFYNTIVRYSVESRNRANADRIAYDYLRRYEPSIPVSCTTGSTLLNRQALPSSADTSGMANPRISVILSCPSPSIANLSKLVARVEYVERGQSKVIEQAIYASR